MPPRRSARVPASSATKSAPAAKPATTTKKTPTKSAKAATPKQSPYFEQEEAEEKAAEDNDGDSAKKRGGWGWAGGRDKSTIGGWAKKGARKSGGDQSEADAEEAVGEPAPEAEEGGTPKKKGGWGWAAGRDKSTIGGWGKKGARSKKDESAPEDASGAEGDTAAEPKPKKKGGWGWEAGRDKSTIGGWGKKGARAKKDESEDATPEATSESEDAEHSDYDDATPPPAKKKVAARGKRKLEESSDDEEPVAKKGKAGKAKDIWREGVSTGLGPGKEVVFKRPRARTPGGIEYQDSTIHPNTLLFLKDLKQNNDRDWLKGV